LRFVLALCGASLAACAQTCDQPLAFYAVAHYQVAHLELKTPFDFLPGVRQEMAAALASAHIAAGQAFSPDAVSAGRRQIRDRLETVAVELNLPLTIDVVTGEIANCHAETTPPNLDVVYSAFTSWFPFHAVGRISELSSDPARAAGAAHSRWRFIPQAAYNRTERLSGGLSASAETALVTFGVDGFASTSATNFSVTQTGAYTSDHAWLRSAEWRTGTTYSDVPTDKGRLKEALATTEVSATSAPLSSAGWILHFGAALSGGHQQTSPYTTAPAGALLNNPAGDLKSYLGASQLSGRHSFRASYGVKAGESVDASHVDYVKHIADVAYEVRFLPADHRPIDVETRFTAGLIQNLGAIPLAERFFGGNQEQDFLLGDSWQIRSGPFIRSIPQNRLNRLAPDVATGGDRFASANLTLAFTAWHRALVPRAIRDNADFRPLLHSELASATTQLQQYWRSKDPGVEDALGHGPAIASALAQVHQAAQNPSDDCAFQLTLAEGLAKDMLSQTSVSRRFNDISSLVAKDDDGSIDQVLACFPDPHGALAEARSEVRAAIARINKPAAEAKAGRDMAFVTRTVNTLIDEVNFASISPVFIFDTATIGRGSRFGVGGGVRLTLLDALRFTAGYAINPNPKPWEGRGAAFLSMEIVSLFR